MNTKEIPIYLRGTEVFRVKPGSYYAVHYAHRIKQIGNGNLDGWYMNIYSMLESWIPEFKAGNLVDVTNDPTQAVDFGEPKGAVEPDAKPETPEVVTFVEDEEAMFAPPVEEPVKKPMKKPAKQRRPGRPLGAKNKNKNKPKEV